MLKLKALKLVFSIIVLLLLPVIGNSIVNESGSFYQFLFGYEPGCAYDNWISHVAEGLVLPGYNDYAPWDRQTPGFGSFVYPDSTQTSQWNTVSNYFVNQQWTSVCEALISYSLPYDLVRFDDTDTGRQYYLLRERLNRNYDDNGTETLADDELGSFDLGWGLFVFNPQATNQIITTVPHPCDDYMSIPIAWKAFTQLNTRYFMISGAGREVMWTNQGTYTNSLTLSDPSRNAAHPLHLTYKHCADEVRTLLVNQNSILNREFSLQIHSYDTGHHIGYANCQMSAGNGQTCVNLPIRDLSRTVPDLINAAGYVIHAANTIGCNAVVQTGNFWAVNYNLHSFAFQDAEHFESVSNHIDLPGYSYNCQQQYTLNQWTNYDVYDPFCHVEMDELPDCYTQNDSTLAWFYGWDCDSLAWNERIRYQKALAYYQPLIDALASSLQHTFGMNDDHTPHTPVFTAAAMQSNSILRMTWLPLTEYDFHTWTIHLERKVYLGNGNYSIIDTLIYDRDIYPALADQALTGIDISGFPLGYHYKIWLTATDKSGRTSDASASRNIVTYSTSPLVTSLSFNRIQTDSKHISLSWTPVPENILINGYRIDRRFPDTYSWQNHATVPPATNCYTDSLFTQPDSLIYEYRIVTLGANGLTYSNSTLITGYFRCYPAPVITGISQPPDGFIRLQWQPVTHTLSGFADNPDYYLITKSSSPDFSSADTQSIEIASSEFNDTYPIIPVWQQRCFYRIKAMAGIRHQRIR